MPYRVHVESACLTETSWLWRFHLVSLYISALFQWLIPRIKSKSKLYLMLNITQTTCHEFKNRGSIDLFKWDGHSFRVQKYTLFPLGLYLFPVLFVISSKAHPLKNRQTCANSCGPELWYSKKYFVSLPMTSSYKASNIINTLFVLGNVI